MKLIVISDVHLHYWKAFTGGHGVSGSRFSQTLKVVRDSLLRARELKCPWVNAGDWVHTIGWVHNGVLTHWIALLREFDDVEKVTVWGNHDSRSHGGEIKVGETVVAALQASVQNLVVLNRKAYKSKSGLVFYGEGYQPSREHLSFITRVFNLDVGVFHQTVESTRLASGHELYNQVSGIRPDELFDRFRLSIVGDVHHPQRMSKDQLEHVILVPGSPEHHNFGDQGDHGWWECEVGEKVHCQLHRGGSPEFITVENASDVKEDGNFYRVLNACDPDDLPDHALAIAPPPVTVQERGLIKEGASAREILQAWMSVDPPQESEKCLALGEQLLEGEGIGSIRPVRLQKVVLKGFMCFAEETFTLSEGTTLVLGEARDFESNGAGKTTLFESIFWCLFGRTTKGVAANEVIQRGQEWAEVQIILSSGLTVTRSRQRGGGGLFSVIGEDGVAWAGNPADLTKDLQKYLGLTPDLFQALAYFSQSKLVLFSQATDSERKGMLSDLCGLEGFQKAAAAARARSLDSQNSRLLLEAQLLGRKGEKALVELSLKEYSHQQNLRKAEREQQLSDLRRDHDSIILKEAEADSTFQAKIIEVAQRCMEQLKQVDGEKEGVLEWVRAQEAQKVLDIRQAYARAIENLPPEVFSVTVEDLRKLLSNLIVSQNEMLTIRGDVMAQVGRRETVVSTLLKQIEGLSRLKDQCPTCGQTISSEIHTTHLNRLNEDLEQAKKDLTASTTDLQNTEQLIRKYSNERAENQSLLTQAATLEEANRTRDKELDKVSKNLQNAEAETQQIIQDRIDIITREREYQIDQLNASLSKEKAILASQAEGVKKRIQEILNERDPFVKLIEDGREKLEKLSAGVLSLSADLKQREEEEKILTYWAKGLSRSGVQSLLLEGVAAAFNQIRSRIFPLLTHGIYDVQFSTTSLTEEGEGREKTSFIIRDRGALVSYESLSGGQRRRIDLGVMLTLSLAVSATRQIPGVLGMLILDEVFGFLDRDGVEALHSVLGEVEKTIPSIYAITHDVDLQSLFAQSLLVRQNEYGVSNLVLLPSMGE